MLSFTCNKCHLVDLPGETCKLEIVSDREDCVYESVETFLINVDVVLFIRLRLLKIGMVAHTHFTSPSLLMIDFKVFSKIPGDSLKNECYHCYFFFSKIENEQLRSRQFSSSTKWRHAGSLSKNLKSDFRNFSDKLSYESLFCNILNSHGYKEICEDQILFRNRNRCNLWWESSGRVNGTKQNFVFEAGHLQHFSLTTIIVWCWANKRA